MSDGDTGYVDLDSHADTFAFGPEFRELEWTGRHVEVRGFSQALGSVKQIRICTAATVYTDDNGRDHVLIVHEALNMSEVMDHSLACPNQMRANGVVVNDVPVQFDATSSHSITVDDLTIPLELRGVISSFKCRAPTDEELAEATVHYELTSSLPWDPNDIEFQAREKAAIQVRAERRIEELELEFMSARSKSLRSIFELSMVQELGVSLESVSRKLEEVTPRTEEPMGTYSREGPIDKYTLAKRWCISLDQAERTLKNTTQRGFLNADNFSERRSFKQEPYLYYPRIYQRFYCDFFIAKVKSIHGHKYALLFTNGLGFSHFVPIHKRSQSVAAAKEFVNQWGIMDELVSDHCKEIVQSKDFKAYMDSLLTTQKSTEPYTQRSNRAEAEIREGKRWIRRFTVKAKSPRCMWPYLGTYVYMLRSKVASNLLELNGMTPEQFATGQVTEIGRLAMFGWWEWVQYKDANGDVRYGRWCGISLRTGVHCHLCVGLDVYNPINRREMFRVPEEDMLKPAVQEEMEKIDEKIKRLLGDHLNLPEGGIAELGSDLLRMDPGEIFDESADGWYPEEPESVVKEEEVVTPEDMDEFLRARVQFSRGGQMQRGTVLRRKRGPDGELRGTRHFNPFLDTREYEVEFPDGSIETYTANTVASNIIGMADADGHYSAMLDSIVDHEIGDDAETVGTFVDSKGRVRNKMTTRGVRLLIAWKDGTTDWIPLKDVKDSQPVMAARYAEANGLLEVPAFQWWAPHVLKKSERIIAKMKQAKTKMRSMKFGIRIPKNVAEAREIDRETGTTFWQDALDREFTNTAHVFEIMSEGEEVKPGYAEVRLHIVYDVKLCMTRKARLVVNPKGAECQLPPEHIYSSVVSRDSVRIFFMLAALNDLKILSADAKNAFVQADNLEKQYAKLDVLGPNFRGKRGYIKKALYGGRAASSTFRNMVATHLRSMGFKHSDADNDVYLRAAFRPNGESYYEYVLVYSDDILVASLNPEAVMDDLQRKIVFKAKPAVPESYLGADVSYTKWCSTPDGKGVWMWGLSSRTYTAKVVAQVETILEKRGMSLNMKHISTPLSDKYKPELDQTEICDVDDLALYQGLIGILRWIVELGRMDIMFAVSQLSRFLSECREGHLDQAFHVFAYLKRHPNSTILMDPTEPRFHHATFQNADWSRFYPDAKEPIPHNMPEPRGKSVVVSCFVDASHANCMMTRRSHTGIIFMVNKAPIMWYSRRQDTVEAATMGSEAIAMRIAMDMNDGLRYKLRMFGVPIDGPTNVFCDNEGVVKCVTRPESITKKKHLSIAINRTRESTAAGSVRIGKEGTKTNLADIGTKSLSGPHLGDLRGRLLH